VASRLEDRKKVDRKTRTFRPLTDEVIRQHLAGEQTIGIYPLLVDETCWFLAVDFDKKTWQEDSAAFLDVCQELRVPAALERSVSGNGGHVWIFFDRIARQYEVDWSYPIAILLSAIEPSQRTQSSRTRNRQPSQSGHFLKTQRLCG